jgi:hypothetical protein
MSGGWDRGGCYIKTDGVQGSNRTGPAAMLAHLHMHTPGTFMGLIQRFD